MEINEHDIVSVNGREGTIVHVYKSGFDYEVEFDGYVETIHIDNIKPLTKEDK